MEDYLIKQILKTLIYIEDHIEKEITLEELAKIACYSPFHFHRIFQSIVGENVHKYIRRLRLEKAVGKLRYSDAPITDIALDANFETSSAFTKAFKQYMGNTPTQYRKFYKEMNDMTKKMEQIATIQPEQIERIADIPVYFIRKLGEYEKSSQEAWDAMLQLIKTKGLDTNKIRYISISYDDPSITEENKLRFDACVYTERNLSELGKQVVKGGKYAVFVHHGSHDRIHETYERIFLKWLAKGKEKFDDARSSFCEHYQLNQLGHDENSLKTKVYIPLV